MDDGTFLSNFLSFLCWLSWWSIDTEYKNQTNASIHSSLGLNIQPKIQILIGCYYLPTRWKYVLPELRADFSPICAANALWPKLQNKVPKTYLILFSVFDWSSYVSIWRWVVFLNWSPSWNTTCIQFRTYRLFRLHGLKIHFSFA